jgi:hypothetical protein
MVLKQAFVLIYEYFYTFLSLFLQAVQKMYFHEFCTAVHDSLPGSSPESGAGLPAASSDIFSLYRRRIRESEISWSFLGIILKVLRLEVSVYNVFITNQFQTTFARGGGGGGGGKKPL